MSRPQGIPNTWDKTVSKLTAKQKRKRKKQSQFSKKTRQEYYVHR